MTTLRDPFAQTHEKNGFTYIGWSQAADRLDEAEPGWSFAIMSLGEDWAHGRLTFPDGRFFENVGYAENASADWKKEVLKDAVSDCFKRCAALAGVARYLYDKDTPNTHAGPVTGSSPRPVSPPRPSGNGGSSRSATPPPAGSPPADEDEAVWQFAMEAAGVPHKAPERPQTAEVSGVCPDHHKPWRSGSRGYYCATKLDDGSWCKQHPSKAWAASQEMVAR